MQLMPSTASGLGVNAFDPAQAIDGAAQLLGGYLQQYNGSVPLSPGRLQRRPGSRGPVRRRPPVRPDHRLREQHPRHARSRFVSPVDSALLAGVGPEEPRPPAAEGRHQRRSRRRLRHDPVGRGRPSAGATAGRGRAIDGDARGEGPLVDHGAGRRRPGRRTSRRRRQPPDHGGHGAGRVRCHRSAGSRRPHRRRHRVRPLGPPPATTSGRARPPVGSALLAHGPRQCRPCGRRRWPPADRRPDVSAPDSARSGARFARSGAGLGRRPPTPTPRSSDVVGVDRPGRRRADGRDPPADAGAGAAGDRPGSSPAAHRRRRRARHRALGTAIARTHGTGASSHPRPDAVAACHRPPTAGARGRRRRRPPTTAPAVVGGSRPRRRPLGRARRPVGCHRRLHRRRHPGRRQPRPRPSTTATTDSAPARRRPPRPSRSSPSWPLCGRRPTAPTRSPSASTRRSRHRQGHRHRERRPGRRPTGRRQRPGPRCHAPGAAPAQARARRRRFVGQRPAVERRPTGGGRASPGGGRPSPSGSDDDDPDEPVTTTGTATAVPGSRRGHIDLHL